MTAGIISARGRDINAGPYDDFLQTDASINRGNSGGPIFNLDGEVIGINTAIFSPSGGSIGIGFAIPSNSAQSVIQQLIEHGEVRRGWLGVRIQTVTEEIADALGLKEAAGALVAGVIPGGPAEKAKIKDGDIITEFDGKQVGQMRRLPRLVADTQVGRTVPIKVWRAGKELMLKVEVGELQESEEKIAAQTPGPETPSRGEKIDAAGARGCQHRRQDARALRAWSADAKGVVVTSIDGDGPAAEQGLRVGDRIVEMAQEPVTTPVAAHGKDQDGRRRRPQGGAAAGRGREPACASSPSSSARTKAAVRTCPARERRRCSCRSRPCGRRRSGRRQVAARPYDVLSFAEAKAGAEGRPWSFLHVSRAEVDLAGRNRSLCVRGLCQGGADACAR